MYTFEMFINKAIKLHNFKYDYTLVDYKTFRLAVKIICKDHGIFEQTPKAHLRPTGCPKCGIIINGLRSRNTTIEFIRKANKVHNNKYTYENTVYITRNKHIIITCPVHGDFKQEPRKHLEGNNCKKCVNRRSSLLEKLWLDNFNIPTFYRNYYITIKNKTYCVDGIDLDNKIIYEFYGDFYHGNPKILRFSHNKINSLLKESYKSLYDKTMNREKFILENSDFRLVTIWESDFLKQQKQIKTNMKMEEQKSNPIEEGTSYIESSEELKLNIEKLNFESILNVTSEITSNIDVYDLDVENMHNYQVENLGIVHNGGGSTI